MIVGKLCDARGMGVGAGVGWQGHRERGAARRESGEEPSPAELRQQLALLKPWRAEIGSGLISDAARMCTYHMPRCPCVQVPAS